MTSAFGAQRQPPRQAGGGLRNGARRGPQAPTRKSSRWGRYRCSIGGVDFRASSWASGFRAVAEKAPQQKSLQSLIFTQSGRRDLKR